MEERSGRFASRWHDISPELATVVPLPEPSTWFIREKMTRFSVRSWCTEKNGRERKKREGALDHLGTTNPGPRVARTLAKMKEKKKNVYVRLT